MNDFKRRTIIVMSYCLNTTANEKSTLCVWENILNLSNYIPLLKLLVLRYLKSRYVGTKLGAIWHIASVMLSFAVYFFVFKYIFNFRLGSVDDSNLFFGLNIFLGLCHFLFFADTVGEACNIIRSNRGLVLSIKFPLIIILLAKTIANSVQYYLSMLLCLIGFFLIGAVSLTDVMAICFSTVLFTIQVLASSIFVSVACHFFKDLEQLVKLLLSSMLFLSPVFFSLSSVSPKLQSYLMLNPISVPIEFARQNLSGEQSTIQLEQIAIYFLATIIWLAISLSVFKRAIGAVHEHM